MVDKSLYPDLPEGCYPPLPPYKGAIFLREGKQEAKSLTVWHHVVTATWELPARAIPGECALIVPDNQIWVWRDDLWCQDTLESEHVARCVRGGKFNTLGVNYIDIPDPSEEAGIVFGGESRREWTVGNWIAHLGGRINNAGYLEFGSVYAFHAMLSQMLRADFKESEDRLRITVDGGTDSMKAALAMLVAGSLGDKHVTPGKNLTALIDRVNNRSVDLNSTTEQTRLIGETDVIIDTLPRLK